MKHSTRIGLATVGGSVGALALNAIMLWLDVPAVIHFSVLAALLAVCLVTLGVAKLRNPGINIRIWQ